MAYCTRGDMMGTIQPDGSPVYVTSAADDDFIEEAAKAIDEALDHDAPQSARALEWANIIGACDLRTDGKLGAAFDLAISALVLKSGKRKRSAATDDDSRGEST